MSDVNVPTVRNVVNNLSKSQLRKMLEYSENKEFSHSWYWHGPAGSEGMNFRDFESNQYVSARRVCGLAVAFDVNQSTDPGNFWGAKVDENLMNAMEHLSEYSGGDIGSANFVLELSKLSHSEFVSIIKEALENPQKSITPNNKKLIDSKYEIFFDRTQPKLKGKDKAPIMNKILSAMTKKQLLKLIEYSSKQPFHHGWYWFGPEGDLGIDSKEDRFSKKGLGDPIAVAFDLNPSRDKKSWRGCKLDDNFMKALEFWSLNSGGESGMEEYVVELNSLSTEELNSMIKEIAASK